MAAPSIGDLFRIGVHVLKTTVSAKTKKILAQIGSVIGEGQTEADNVEWWQHVGFASRPAKPNKGKEAPQTVVIRSGGIDAAIASQDLRGLELYGQLAEGETCIYATGEEGTAQARILLKKDGSINLFTKEGNDSGGSGMGVFINPSGAISVVSANGAGILIKDDGNVQIFNSSSAMQVKDTGVKIASSGKVELSGASITLGGLAALPLAVGPQTVTAITALQTQITALQVECAAIAAALVACMNIAGPIVPATHGAAAAAATTAVGVAAAILATGTAGVAAASPLIPTKRTSAD